MKSLSVKTGGLKMSQKAAMSPTKKIRQAVPTKGGVAKKSSGKTYGGILKGGRNKSKSARMRGLMRKGSI